jgi:hypothetical protein
MKVIYLKFQGVYIGTNPNVYKKQQGCIWQLLTMGQKAAKLPNYCILHWRLNALNLAASAGVEPATCGLTVRRSTD